MAEVKSFTGYLTSALVGTQNMAAGQTFNPATTAEIYVLLADNDPVNHGDPGGEVSSDPDGDQIAFIQDNVGTVLIDGSEVYLELTFQFTVGAQTFTGYQFEIEGTGEDFVILPPNVPAGVATVNSVDFTPTPDEAGYWLLGSGDEDIDESVFTNLDLSGQDDLRGGGGSDTVSAGSGDDIVYGNAGDDVLNGAAGGDWIIGGDGDDTIDAGSGADFVIADGVDDSNATRLSFNWSLLPDPSGDATPIDDGDDLSAGVSQDTGGIQVDIAYTDLGPGSGFTYENNGQFVGDLNSGSETVNANSGGRLTGAGVAAPGDTSQLDITFSSTNAAFGDEVSNVTFRINDVDESSWRDRFDFEAFDAAGNPVPVNLVEGTNHSVSDNDAVPGEEDIEVNNGAGNGNSADEANSLLVEIPGPVARLLITYGNAETGGQLVDFTDIFFDANPPATGDDSIQGGAGDDTIIAGDGDDAVDGGLDNDSILGGDGRDTIDGGAGNDTIDGGFWADSITGGTGDDSLTGGGSNDIFTYASGDGNDTIADFNTGNTGPLGDGDNTNNDFVNLSAFYDNLAELYADQADDGILNQSNATDTKGRTVDYSDNDALGGSITFTGASPDNSFYTTDNTAVICFARGTLIRTPQGDRPVETLAVGDSVLTADNGPQVLRWIGSRRIGSEMLTAHPDIRPVEIAPGTLGNDRALFVSPQHRMLIGGWRAQVLFGETEVLVAARDLINDDSIRMLDVDSVQYLHLMFDAHEIVFANGARAESLHPGPQALATMTPAMQHELALIFPDLRPGNDPRPLARRSLRGFEARALAR